MPQTLPSDLPAEPAAAALPAGGPWQGFGGRGLKNQVLCLGVALLIWLLGGPGHGGFLVVWLYSAAIGLGCWFFIDGSRIVLSLLLQRRQRAAGTQTQPAHSRWPGALGMLPCIVLGTLAGYSAGTALADALTGLRTPSLMQNSAALIVCLLAAVGATFYFYANERLHQERAAADAARRLATESALRLLQSQLEPHMLFNTLANLRVLIARDPAAAQAMLDRLIAFLRATLGGSRSGLHPLAAEFDRVADYLALMAVRMGPRLAVQLDLPDALRALPVPPLLLQPLVENAIRHGLEPQVAGGRIEVRARVEGGLLVLEVLDDGSGPASPSPGSPGDGGYGTAHVRERLAAMYGAQGRFSLQARAEGGTLARISLPLPAPAEPRTAGETNPGLSTPRNTAAEHPGTQ